MLLYRFVLRPILSLILRAASLGNPKARRGLAGRGNWRGQLPALAAGDKGAFGIHFHAASAGEFEQAKPLIEALRRRAAARYRITASFFSASGYEQQSGYAGLDAACYLPEDRPDEMGDFLERLLPDLVIIIRYDLWYELLSEARRRHIPVALVCGTLRADSARFNPFVGKFFRKLHGLLSVICAATEQDERAFRLLAPSVPIMTCGDTRYDRVLEIVRAAPERLPPCLHRERLGARRVLVAGSTWRADEELLRDAVPQPDDLLRIIVPHEPTAEHVARLKGMFADAATLSRLEAAPDKFPHAGTVIVDRTGILSALYSVADIAYVGGGFGQGVHSVLEPAAYGIRVACGPKIGRSRDAVALHAAGGLVVVTNGGELAAWLGDAAGGPARDFVAARAGATGRVLDALSGNGLLP